MFFYDFVFAREDGGPIDFYIFDGVAEFFGALEVIVNVGVVQEHFRRDAADVQASAAEKRIFFDDGNFQAPLCGANPGGIWAIEAFAMAASMPLPFRIPVKTPAEHRMAHIDSAAFA